MMTNEEIVAFDVVLLPFAPLGGMLPEVSAVYFALSSAGDVLYVGKANNLRSRWAGHHRKAQLRKFKNVRIAWMELPEDDLLDMESLFIVRFDPPLNNAIIQETGKIEDQGVRHCSQCRYLGKIGQYVLFVCNAHGESRLMTVHPTDKFEPFIVQHFSLFDGSDLSISIAPPHRIESEPEPIYEDFHEFP